MSRIAFGEAKMATTWDPKQYLKFAGPRLRPALDLLAQIYVDDVKTIYDLGSGPGNLTQHFKDRWPEAQITGIDNSEEMLDAAREAHPDVTWIKADLTTWRPDEPADVLYSNATLQWIAGHEVLLPRLVTYLKPGGVLAVQMPRNHGALSHTLMEDAIKASAWEEKIRGAHGLLPVPGPEVYYDILHSCVNELNIWESKFLQILEGDNAVAQWTKGTALKPYLDMLGKNERQNFFDDYSARVQRAYPKHADGKTLFPFCRLFIVARL